MWSALRHPNVLPLFGATMAGVQFIMVSEWMTNGNISEFVKAHPGADRIRLVGFPFEVLPSPPSLIIAQCPQLKDVGEGLVYLHSQEMAHGDLKGVRFWIYHCFARPRLTLTPC